MSGTKEIIASLPLSLKLSFLVLITLFTRIYAFFQTPIISNDGIYYVQLAKLFSEGKYDEFLTITTLNTLGTVNFNLYSFLLFLVHSLLKDWQLSGQLISVALSTLTAIPIFLLGRSLYNEKVGWLSTLFYIFLPDFLRYGSDVIRDPTNWFFVAMTLWLVWSGIQKNQLICFSLASISAGLGVMTRVEGVILWGALALFVAFKRVSRISLRRKVFSVLLLVSFFPLLISPIFLILKGDSSETPLRVMVWNSIDIVERRTRAIFDPSYITPRIDPNIYRSLSIISKNFLELADRHRIMVAVSEIIYKFVKSANLLIILVILGLWKKKKEGFETSDWYLLYTLMVLFVVSLLYTLQTYYFSTRHGLTLVVPGLFFASYGLVSVGEILFRKLNPFFSGGWITKKYFPPILTLCFLIIFILQGISSGRMEKRYLKEAGLWLKEKGYQGSVMMGTIKFSRLAFYADAQFLEISDSWEKVVEGIHRNKVRVIIIDPCTIEQDCPGFVRNYSQAGLFLLRDLKEKKEPCSMLIYGIN